MRTEKGLYLGRRNDGALGGSGRCPDPLGLTLRSGSPGMGQKFTPLERREMWSSDRVKLDRLLTGEFKLKILSGVTELLLLVFIQFRGFVFMQKEMSLAVAVRRFL